VASLLGGTAVSGAAAQQDDGDAAPAKDSARVDPDQGIAGDTASPARGWVRIDPRHRAGGDIDRRFVGLSIEWSLIERYMGPNARPAFANLLANLDSGILRIGGSSQDQMRFDASAENTNQIITPEDIEAIRAALDASDAAGEPNRREKWAVVLGTALARASENRPWIGPEHTRAFIEHGVRPAFEGADADDIAGIELGNEPDLSYGSVLAPYLERFREYVAADATDGLPIIAPATSEPIAAWERIAAREVPTRFFWDWPEILDTTAPAMHATASDHGTWATDHFYPMARGCTTDAYRCPTIPRLLSDERMDNFNYGAYKHADEAAQRGLGYRLGEINTSAGRGAQGVSDVAASATWALDVMFNAACPQPPDRPGVNAACKIGASGVNFHNAEVNAFYRPEEGNAYYNTVRYDPSPLMGAPSAAPEYYALLLFAEFAQGTDGLRPVAVSTEDGSLVKGWQVQGEAAERRLFLINKSDHSVDMTVSAPAASYQLNRMSPHDPTGAGRTLDAPEMRIDGRAVSADGAWPGFDATEGAISRGRFEVSLGSGEAVVITLHGKGR